jgi:hypothetical protein
MGKEIDSSGFTVDDFARFHQRLAIETRHAHAAYARGDFANAGLVAGFELEAWLVDEKLSPVPRNVSFLERLASPLVVPELSRFNVELNGTPQPLRGGALSRLECELTATWQQCLRVAREEESALIAIGTLPTVHESDLSLASMSPSRRYAMLNEQILVLRGGRPLALDISGIDSLCTTHADVMLEAATTSFQVHLQTPAGEAARTYNASLLLAAPLVALAANSPFLFERALWHETRIPLFEQAVDCCDPEHPEHLRVTFGSGYLGADPTACFAENLSSYTVLLPFEVPSPVQSYAHLRLHNGTIWRWIRMLIGFDDNDQPHLRVEQRVMPAGPSLDRHDCQCCLVLWRGTHVWPGRRKLLKPGCRLPLRAKISTVPHVTGLEARGGVARWALSKCGRTSLKRRTAAAGSRRTDAELDLAAADITRVTST